MVRVLHSAQLAFQKNGLILFQGLIQIYGNIAHIRFHHISVLMDGLQQFFGIDGIFAVQVLQQDILLHADALDLLPQDIVVLEEFVDLPADLGVFIGIKRSDA